MREIEVLFTNTDSDSLREGDVQRSSGLDE
jgi:hypothetical protein